MARKTKEELLEDLRRNKRNRQLEEAQRVLALYGFSCRPGAKEQGGVWQKGRHRVVLPKPHGNRDKVLGQAYVRIVIEVIDAAEVDASIREQGEGAD